ncbi:MAG: endolytic transglycosylase MltG, partial [Sphingomonadales bacterium]
GASLEGTEGKIARASMAEVLAIIRSGRVVQHRLTVAEGLTSAQVIRVLGTAEALGGPAPDAPAEGAILPETYNFTRGTPRAELLARMTGAMDAKLVELWAARDPELTLASAAEAVILASIVEKETGVAEERPRVAAVFLNRLRTGMRLQSDPTVVYAVTGGEAIGRRLTRADLNIDSPYNTYRNHGLPPGPIANPGAGSLRAVLNPIQTDDLYFVADGTGGHAFARTLEEHNRNVRAWRQIRRQLDGERDASGLDGEAAE